MRKLKPIAALILVFVFVHFSCKKMDTKITPSDKLEEKFLSISPTAPCVIKRIAETIRKQDEKFHFLNKFIKEQGFPRWDKSPVFSRPEAFGLRTKNAPGDTIVLVPLVKIDSARVTAFLACRVNDDSVQIKLYRADRFGTYPASNSTDSLTSTFIAYQTMILDNLTFGYTRFELKDKRIFNYNADTSARGSRLLVLKPQTNASARNASFVYATVCGWVTVYPTGYNYGLAPNQPGYYPHDEWRCIGYYVYVQTFYPDISDGGPTSFPDAGGTGTGYTNPTGAMYFWNTNSCGDPNSPATPVESDCMNGVIGWQPIPLNEEWFNALPPYSIDVTGLAGYPCAQAIAQNVIQLNNSTIKTIKDIFGESVKYNIYFDAIVSDPNSNASSPPHPQWIPIPNGTNGPLTQLDISIHLNPSLLNEATKLSIAETIIHEMIHAYFYYRSIDAFGDLTKTQKLKEELSFLETYDPNNPPSNSEILQHQQMAQTYVEKIALALKEYKLISDQDLNDLRNTLNYPNITVEDFYKAMAWSGLYYQDKTSIAPDNETKAWHEFKEQEPTLALQYQNIMTIERTGTWTAPSHEKCN